METQPKNQTTNPATATNTTWVIDPAHSSISFVARHMLITNVKGTFDKFEGKVTVPGASVEDAQVEVTIDVNSINTGVEGRDQHLKSPDFFDAAQYPAATFTSTDIEKIDNEHYRIHGDLTIRSIKRTVVLDAEYGGAILDPYGNERMGFMVSGKINRFDYELKWNALLETGGAVVGAEIKLYGDVSLIKQKP